LKIRAALDIHEATGTTGDSEYKQEMLEFLHRHLCRLDPWPPVVEELLRSTSLEVYNTMWGPSEAHPTGVLAGWDVTSRLGEIRMPTLVLCGRHDEATPQQAETIAAALPDAELVVFEESAHTGLRRGARALPRDGARLPRPGRVGRRFKEPVMAP